MARKKKVNKELTEIQNLSFYLLELTGKVKALDERIRQLIKYSEYIATAVDMSVNYSEYLGRVFSKDRPEQIMGNQNLSSNINVPTFKEFCKQYEERGDAEIPF